ncbi:hypothetical protein CYMTET_9628 [Cymbomonas tetramitiformis]|uniref:LRRK2 beta-propeller domain-containing protein n=1 Tax=Cymbomonas tetramitiformis TaxID=36881 RepID=A0AAE0GR36_9CHLO|nr:hypothetical protein CYMTET_9628 [Cymbomonas tetramitiformis]|eukprot:gene6497-7790_t
MGKDGGKGSTTLEVTRTFKLNVPTSSAGENRLKGLEALTSKYGSRVVQPKEDLGCTIHFPELRFVFTGREDGSIAVWNLRSERSMSEAKFLHKHKGAVTCLLALEKGAGATLSPLLLSGSADSTIKLWDPSKVTQKGCEGACVQTLGGHGGTVTEMTRCGDYLLSASTDRTVRLWRTVHSRVATLYPWFELQKTLATCDGWVHSLCYDITHKVGDMGAIYAADSTGAVARFKPRPVEGATRGDRTHLEFDCVQNNGRVATSSPPPLVFRRLHDRGISHVRFLAELSIVLTVAYDNRARLYDSRTGQCLFVIENPHECCFTDVEWDEEHQQIYFIDKYGFFFVYDVQAEGMVFEKKLTNTPLVSIIYDKMLDSVAVSAKDRVEFWRISREVDYNALPGGHCGPVINVQVAMSGGEGSYIFSASLDNTIRVWDPYDMSCLRVLQEDRSEISCMVYSEGKSTLVTGHDNGCIRLWNLDTQSTINLTEHSNTVSCLVTAPLKRNEEFVLTGGFDGKVGIWDVRKKHSVRPHLVTMFEAHPNSEILCLLHDSIKATIITAGNDAVIKVWSATTYELVGEHRGHLEAVICLTLDANFLFSGSEDCSIRVWDSLAKGGTHVKGRTHIKTLQGHQRPVTGIAILEETGHLVSCSLDGSLRIWNYTMGEVLKTFRHKEELRCLAFRPDTNAMLVGTMQDNILLFPLPEDMHQLTRRTSSANSSVPAELKGYEDILEKLEEQEAAELAAAAAEEEEGYSSPDAH